MGTRGAYGFRKNNEDKLTYNHFDSYPEWLGNEVVDFCKSVSIKELNEIYDRIELIDTNNSTPTPEQIKKCEPWTDLGVSEQSTSDWYCLLRKAQGNLAVYKEGIPYMPNHNNFILDSLFCEYAYIINLDDNVLEFWRGFQDYEDPSGCNRYGETKDGRYGPCRLLGTFQLPLAMETETYVEQMELLTKEEYRVRCLANGEEYEEEEDETEDGDIYEEEITEQDMSDGKMYTKKTDHNGDCLTC